MALLASKFYTQLVFQFHGVVVQCAGLHVLQLHRSFPKPVLARRAQPGAEAQSLG